MGPNVLMVVFDAARRDALEPYGAPAGSTPTVADVARRGQALDRVYATAPWTVPSHASMFTGLMPRAAGLSRVPSPSAAVQALQTHRDRMLPAVLKRAGYRTGAVSANLWLSRASGFDSGFDDFTEVETGRNSAIRTETVAAKLRWYYEAARARADDGATQALTAVQSLASGPRPFFAFVNLLECHSPYLPPRPYGGWAPLQRLRAAADARRYYTLTGIWRACAGVERVPDDTLERGRRFYAASIRYMDDWLAQVMGALDRQKLLDETLLIVLSDHGENFGEEGLIGHGLSLDNRLIHVPFVASGPSSDRLDLTSLVDLPRVLADICGADSPYERQLPPEVGVAQFDPPAAVGEEENRDKLRGIGIDGPALERFVTPLTCAVKGDLKLLKRGSEELLFDLSADPLETRPMPVEQARAEWREEIRAMREAIRSNSDVTPATSASTGSGRELDPDELRDLEERMQLLGYM